MKTPDSPRSEQEVVEILKLGDFDLRYFKELQGENGWLALGLDNCSNQRYKKLFSDPCVKNILSALAAHTAKAATDADKERGWQNQCLRHTVGN